jgi:hypothetical protein
VEEPTAPAAGLVALAADGQLLAEQRERLLRSPSEDWDMALSWNRMRRFVDRDVLLRQLGLEQRTPGSDFFTGLGLFSIGVLVGAGLGLLFAPRRGEDMRALVSEAWRKRDVNRLAEVGHQIGAEAGVTPSSTMGH